MRCLPVQNNRAGWADLFACYLRISDRVVSPIVKRIRGAIGFGCFSWLRFRGIS